MRRLPLLLGLLVSIALLSGCIAGKLARDRTLSPVVTDVTPRIVDGAKLAPNADVATLDKFQAAVTASDWATANTLWPQVKAAAEAAIEARLASSQIGPTVAESLRERLAQYGAQLGKLGGVTP